MILNRLSKKFLKITAIIFGSILVLLTAFHFWFIHHAEGLIEELVESRSKGKLRLDVRKFKFNWFSYDMELRDAVFFSADSSTASTSYRFSVKNIHIRVREIIPLVFEKKILIDSLRLVNPDIRVSRLREVSSRDSATRHSVSLPQEMGRVYKSIQDALDVLKVSRFHIDNGKFTLINKVQTDALPVTITNIDFHLENLQVDTSVQAGMQKILFSDNVALQTHDQNILFPDGRHRLQFKNFRINVLNKLVEFDSCTISATKDDSSRSAFTIFFDKLLLTNIDFDTLYQKEIIKADSVYCINPKFRLDVELSERTGPPKPPPKLDELIQQLTGDLELAFVVVQNGSFDINTVRNDRPSSFTSTNNNFEMQGLRIRKEGPKPLTVKSFSMAIRNYENFLGDSSYAMQFDSIRLINNSILLNNFSLKQMRNGDTVNSFSMPQFELRGLSWDDLVFEQRLSAERATLYRPVINYTVPRSRSRNNHDIFSTLAGIGDIIALNQLNISDGQVNVFFNGNSSIQLQNAYVSISANDLAASKKFETIQRSVRALNFRTGTIVLNDLTAKFDNVIFTGEKGRLTAHSAALADKNKNVDIRASGISMKGLKLNDNQSLTTIEGLQWKNADIRIRTGLDTGPAAGSFLLSDLTVGNTNIHVSGKSFSFAAFHDRISLDRINVNGADRINVANLRTSGSKLEFRNNAGNFTAANFSLTDNGRSTIRNGKFKFSSLTDSIAASLPEASFDADFNSLLTGKISGKYITLSSPVVNISSSAGVSPSAPNFPHIRLDQLTLDQPLFTVSFPGRPLSSVKWNAREKNKDFVRISGLAVDSNKITWKLALLDLHDLELQVGTRKFSTDEGSVLAEVESFSYSQLEGKKHWSGKINDLRISEISIDSLGEKNDQLQIVSARMNDIFVHDSSFTNLPRLVKENLQFRLQDITGSFRNEDVRYDWKNVGFDKNTKLFSLDSFSYRPTPERDAFIAKQEKQNDHISFSTGKITAGPFDIDTYFIDTIINAGTITIDNGKLNSFRDKRKPFEGGIIKPLPVNALRKIPINLLTDSIKLTNSFITYEELNEKTGLTGSVKLNQLNALVTTAKNFRINQDDSLRIIASARLMDSIAITLSMTESYDDTLSGFLLRARVGNADVRVLNEILGPLASIRLQSGYLDSLNMRVVANEHLAFGEIDLRYRDLKVRMLRNGSDEKRGLFKGFVNFLANTFIIRNKNKDRTSLIFQERNREKSAINYVVKITLSGVANGIGLRNNKKLMRKYKKGLRKRNLPPVNFDMKTGN